MALLPGIGPKANFSNGNTNVRTRRGAERAMRFSFRGAFKYTFFPGIMPRIRQFGSHFGIIAHMLACIFASAKLLPKGHPMLNPVNIGRYGVIDVIAAAANNLVIKRENSDQILIFGAIILAMIMIVIQVAMLAFYSVIGSAYAGGAPAPASSNMFTTANPDNDIVLMFLQQTIGADNFFNGNDAVGFSIAAGLHSMLGFYSTAMMVIAVFIVLYYVVVVVGESAQSGKPFGGRFNSLWAPIRLVLALGLLVPLSSGLNAAQYLTLYVAKAGSSLATNAWANFSGIITDPSKTIVPPYPLGVHEIAKQVFMSEVCMAAYNGAAVPGQEMKLSAWVPWHKKDETIATVQDEISSINKIEGWFNNGNNVTLEWGYIEPDWGNTAGLTQVARFSCGRINFSYAPPPDGSRSDEQKVQDEAALAALKAYAHSVGMIIEAVRPEAEKFGRRYVHGLSTSTGTEGLPTAQFLINVIEAADDYLRKEFVTGTGKDYSHKMMEAIFPDKTELTTNGWGMAATYYSKLAFANTTMHNLFDAAAPTYVDIDKTDETLGQTMDGQQRGLLFQWFGDKWYDLGDRAYQISNAMEEANAIIVEKVSGQTAGGAVNRAAFSNNWSGEDNKFHKLIVALFGLSSLEGMADPNNVHVFPMVHLVNIGNELITKAVNAFLIGGAVSIGGGIASIFNEGAGAAIAAIGNLIFIFGFIGLGIGFILAMVVPMMPMIYFFFAIVEWGMSVVEALVGVPLWALAHLRIDGDGLPGQAAMNGYYILFGMLIKPFLILFSLLASFIVFNGGALLLNYMFGSYVFNLATVNPGPAAAAFGMLPLGGITFVGMLILYGVIVYNLGLVSFKLIDTIPAQSMRWLGQGNLNFNDGKPDPIGNMSGVAMAAGGIVGGQLASGVGSIGKGAGAYGASKTKAGKAALDRQARGRTSVSDG